MSIKFDVVYSDNRRIPIMGPCFGSFSEGREFPGHSLRYNELERRNEDRESIRGLWGIPENARFLQFYCQPRSNLWAEKVDDVLEEKPVWSRRYYDEMKLLLADIPWLKASIHPLLGVIRVKLDGVPADKVMMTLFLVRNLAHYDYANGYRKLREEGMKPFAAAIFSSLWKYNKGNTFIAPAWHYNSVGEYNWLSPYTFGRASLAQLVQAPDDFHPWVQQPWTVQNGYRRDRWFRNQVDFFNPVRDENGQAIAYHRTTSEYRRLIDCLSVQGDTPIWEDVIRLSYRTDSWTNHDWHTHDHGSNLNLEEGLIDQILEEFCTQCRAAGYEPYER